MTLSDTHRRLTDTTLWSEVPDLRQKFLRLLQIQRVLPEEEIVRLVDLSAEGRGSLSQVILEENLMPEAKLVDCLEQASGYPAVDPRLQEPTSVALERIPLAVAIEHRCLPLRIQGDKMLVVMENPVEQKRKADLQERIQLQIEPYVYHTDGIFRSIERAYPGADAKELEHIAREVGDMRIDPPEEIEVEREETDLGLLYRPLSDVLFSPISDVLSQPLFTTRRLVKQKVRVTHDVMEGDRIEAYSANPESASAVTDLIFKQALAVRATDIHIEPFQDSIRIRIRRDSTLSTLNYLALEMHTAVINRIKVLARLDLAERRKIQEGAFRYSHRPGEEVNFRVSVMPTTRGETAELRVIDGRQGRWDLSDLGMGPRDLDRFEGNLTYPNGLILITGPTASGKTTTLYSALKRLNNEGRKILTAEDPIEFELYGITQVEVNRRTGITYGAALKAFLRQDPDVLMLGEIRDGEVANVAISAALTGHLVLAALHTNDAASASSRLLSTMSCDPMLVCDSLLMVVGQRLVRVLCTACKEEQPVDVSYRDLFGEKISDIRVDHFASGCRQCRQTGFSGMSAVFEVMDVTPAIKQNIFDKAPTSKVFATAVADGMVPMQQNALDLVRKGMIGLAEVQRVLMYKRLF